MRLRHQHVERGIEAGAWVVAVLVVAWSAGLLAGDAAPAAVAAGALVLASLQLVASRIARRIRIRRSFAAVPAVLVTVASFAACGIAGTIAGVLVLGAVLPIAVVPTATIVAIVLQAASRHIVGQMLDLARRRSRLERALVYGAGSLGAVSVHQMHADESSPYRAVGMLDDDPRVADRDVEGVRVLGTLDDLARMATATSATTLVVAVAHADAALLQRAADAATAAGLVTKVFPPLAEVLAGRTQLVDLRDVEVSDLIGRRPIDTDVERVSSAITGKRVLVTGAGGSIGAELCRQLHRLDPAELLMVDRDETVLQSLQVDLHGDGLLTSPSVVLADIRDRAEVMRLFLERRPEVVLHAAALKHLPLLERHPDEAWKTNVLGTRNVLEAAAAADVHTFVNVSTDKAADPTSVLGRSKRLAEELTAAQAERTGRRYLSVRFGNVLGSRGSMVPLFARLIAEGRPITVTHPDVTRYFMTIPEACQLVIQASAIGAGGEVLVLDMGEPVRILDIAERMIAMSGRDVEIVFTGLRQGEKLHERLLGVGELDQRPFHPLISHTTVPAIDPSSLDAVRREWLAPVPRGTSS